MANILDMVVEISNRRANCLAELARIDAELVRACSKVSQSVPNNSAPEAADQTFVRGQAKPAATTTTAITPAATDAPKRRGRKPKGAAFAGPDAPQIASSSEQSGNSDPGGLGLGDGPADEIADDPDGPDGESVDDSDDEPISQQSHGETRESKWFDDERLEKLPKSTDRAQAAWLLDAITDEYDLVRAEAHEDAIIKLAMVQLPFISSLRKPDDKDDFRSASAVLVLLSALQRCGILGRTNTPGKGTHWRLV